MRVFVTGATGFIGTEVVRELIGAGHSVVGLARAPEKAAALEAAGAEARIGSIDAPEELARFAAEAEGVVHLAFNHDFSDFAAICATDRRVIMAIGEALAGSGKPFVVTSGTAIAVPVEGRPAVEQGLTVPETINPRAASEAAALGFAARGVRVCVVRLPQVHDPRRQGLFTYVVATARERGVLAYVGDGANRWPAAPVRDVARLYRLTLERGAAGARYHAVAEEGVAVGEMMRVAGQRLGLLVRAIPAEEAGAFYGWLAMFAGLDMPASSAWTREALDWTPSGPTLLEDLARLE